MGRAVPASVERAVHEPYQPPAPRGIAVVPGATPGESPICASLALALLRMPIVVFNYVLVGKCVCACVTRLDARAVCRRASCFVFLCVVFFVCVRGFCVFVCDCACVCVCVFVCVCLCA
jgi:hypothetical protein